MLGRKFPFDGFRPPRRPTLAGPLRQAPVPPLVVRLPGCARERRGLPLMPHVFLRFTRSAGPDPNFGFSGRLNHLISSDISGQAGQASECLQWGLPGWGAVCGPVMVLKSHVFPAIHSERCSRSRFGWVSGRFNLLISWPASSGLPCPSHGSPGRLRDSAVSRAAAGLRKVGPCGPIYLHLLSAECCAILPF